MVWDFLAVDNFDFTRKIVKKFLGFFFFVKIEFLYKNLTFIIVCLAGFSESLVNSDSDSDSMTPYEEYVIYFLCRFHQS